LDVWKAGVDAIVATIVPEPKVCELLTVYVPLPPAVPVNWVVMVGEPGSDSV